MLYKIPKGGICAVLFRAYPKPQKNPIVLIETIFTANCSSHLQSTCILYNVYTYCHMSQNVCAGAWVMVWRLFLTSFSLHISVLSLLHSLFCTFSPLLSLPVLSLLLPSFLFFLFWFSFSVLSLLFSLLCSFSFTLPFLTCFFYSSFSFFSLLLFLFWPFTFTFTLQFLSFLFNSSFSLTLMKSRIRITPKQVWIWLTVMEHLCWYAAPLSFFSRV